VMPTHQSFDAVYAPSDSVHQRLVIDFKLVFHQPGVKIMPQAHLVNV